MSAVFDPGVRPPLAATVQWPQKAAVPLAEEYRYVAAGGEGAPWGDG